MKLQPPAHFLPGLLPACAALILLGGMPVFAQDEGPAAARAVFKCDSEGQTMYTDTPCAGGQRLVASISPALGAVPLEVESAIPPAQSAASSRSTPEPRVAAPPDGLIRVSQMNPECPHLSQRMAMVEAEERTATNEALRIVHERLNVQRRWYREFGCG